MSVYPSFACVLDDQPLFTSLGRPMRGPQASTAGDAVPAPGLIITHTNELGLPAECSRGPIACTDTGDGTSMPMWLGPEGVQAVQTLLRCGSTAALPARWRQLLVSAGLAVDPSDVDPSDGATNGSGGARELCTTFTPVAMMLHPFHLGALRLHVRRLLRLGVLQDGDGQTPLRWVQYNDPVTCWIHGYLAAGASQAAGTRVKPSYTYTIVYHDGADLPAHIDREQCEYTLSMCVDCLPEPPSAVPWPLILETEAARVSVYQRIGDSLLFRGRHIRHSRPRLAAGLVVASILFHFVDDEYGGSLD
jgi:hypothetical protein